jgi:hypothetical protein
LKNILVLGEAFRPDILARLGLATDDSLVFDTLTADQFRENNKEQASNRWSVVLNLLPRRATYRDIRKTLSIAKLTSVELNLGLYRRSLAARIKTLKLLRDVGLDQPEPGGGRGNPLTPIADIFSKFVNPADYLLASAPRNMRLTSTVARKRLIVETFLQTDMKRCANAALHRRAGNYVLFIDDAVSTSADWAHVEGGAPATIREYSEEMLAILDLVQSTFGCELIIAGHPGSKVVNKDHQVFGKFEVIYGQTPELIKGALAVATHQSTAIYQALYTESDCFLILPKCLQGTFYGALIESLGSDASIPVYSPDGNRLDPDEVFSSTRVKRRRLDYLRYYVGVPAGASNIRSTLETILASIEGMNSQNR